MRTHLVLGPGCIIVASSSRIRIKVISSVLVWWLWTVWCISTVEVCVLAVLSPVTTRWLKSNRSILLFRPTFSGIVSLSISLAWIIAIVLSIARRRVCVSVISCVVSVSASCVVPWVSLASPVHGVISISISVTRIIAWSSVSVVRHVIGVSFERPDEFVENGSVFCQRVICHVTHTSRTAAGCPNRVSSL